MLSSYDVSIATTLAEQARDNDGATKEDIGAWYDTWRELYGKEIADEATKIFHEIA